MITIIFICTAVTKFHSPWKCKNPRWVELCRYRCQSFYLWQRLPGQWSPSSRGQPGFRWGRCDMISGGWIDIRWRTHVVADTALVLVVVFGDQSRLVWRDRRRLGWVWIALACFTLSKWGLRMDLTMQRLRSVVILRWREIINKMLHFLFQY